MVRKLCGERFGNTYLPCSIQLPIELNALPPLPPGQQPHFIGQATAINSRDQRARVIPSARDTVDQNYICFLCFIAQTCVGAVLDFVATGALCFTASTCVFKV